MRKTVSFIILTTFSACLSGQANYSNFKKLFKDNDTTKIKLLLAEWEKTSPGDAELYTCAFNFYFSNSKQEIISLQQKDPQKESYQLTDSTGAVAGFLTTNLSYNPDKLRIAFRYINTGIEKFPDRLDMRFGKCYVLQQIGDYDNFTKEIVKAIEYSNTNRNNWLWTENKKQVDGQGFMLGTIQSYLGQLYNTGDDNLLPNMIDIGTATLKYYPNSVEILSTTAVALMLTKEYDKAIGYLKTAEQQNPKDFIVLNNIAQGYKMKGDKENAIKYYELTEKYGDDEAKQKARQNIKALKL